MSRLVRNLTKSGAKVHNKWNFRGRPGSKGSGGTMDFKWNPSFFRAIDKKTNDSLFYSGRGALRRYKQILGKKKPTKLTKTGRISRAFLSFQAGKRHQYPYRVTGVLRHGTEFYVNRNVKNVIAGPYLITGLSLSKVWTPSKPIPQLLNEGGMSIHKTRSKFGSKRARTVNVRYKAYPYTKPPFEVMQRLFAKQMEKPWPK